MAMMSALDGSHSQSILELKNAQYCLPGTEGKFMFSWYQLVDAVEWIFRLTGHDGYRELCIDMARIHQKILPFDSWAYAVEAKWTYNVQDKIRATAMTLYMDENSSRISKLPPKLLKEARAWLESNNMFKLEDEKMKQAI
jgi:hypothetical protein